MGWMVGAAGVWWRLRLRRVSGSRRDVAAQTIIECDRALAVLQSTLMDLELEAELVRLGIDRVLDRRNELVDGSRLGAQS